VANMYHLWLWEAPIDATDKSTNLSFMQVNTANAFILLSAVGRVWLRQHPLYFLHRNCITRHQTCTATIVRSQCTIHRPTLSSHDSRSRSVFCQCGPLAPAGLRVPRPTLLFPPLSFLPFPYLPSPPSPYPPLPPLSSRP